MGSRKTSKSKKVCSTEPLGKVHQKEKAQRCFPRGLLLKAKGLTLCTMLVAAGFVAFLGLLAFAPAPVAAAVPDAGKSVNNAEVS